MCARRYGIFLRVLESRYLFEQEKSSSIYSCNRLLFCLLYKSRGPLPIRKIDSINIERNISHSFINLTEKCKKPVTRQPMVMAFLLITLLLFLRFRSHRVKIWRLKVVFFFQSRQMQVKPWHNFVVTWFIKRTFGEVQVLLNSRVSQRASCCSFRELVTIIYDYNTIYAWHTHCWRFCWIKPSACIRIKQYGPFMLLRLFQSLFFLSKEYYNYYEAFSQSKQEPKRLQRHLHLNTFGFLTNTMHIKTMMKTPPPNTPTVAAML